MKVFVSRRIAEAALSRVRAECEVDLWDGESPPSPSELRARVAGCDGLLCLLTEKVDVALLDAAPRLKVVSNVAVGVDNIDLGACSARKIPVGHTPGVLVETTADLAFGLMLASARRIVEGQRYVQAGRWKTWEPTLFLGAEVHGATLGIAGFGPIGQAVARRAKGFGMRVLYTSRTAHSFEGAAHVDKATLLRESDFLSVHLALNADTRHWLRAEDFAQMKPGSTLINTARGAVLDEVALISALEKGRPGFAALDVTDPEPPSIDSKLLKLPNALVIPHLGSATVATRTKMALRAVDNLLAGLRGAPLVSQANRPV